MSWKITLRVDYRTYVQEVIHHHGVPVSIISIRAFQFTPTSWRALQEQLGTQVDLIITFNLYIAGNSKCTFRFWSKCFKSLCWTLEGSGINFWLSQSFLITIDTIWVIKWPHSRHCIVGIDNPCWLFWGFRP